MKLRVLLLKVIFKLKVEFASFMAQSDKPTKIAPVSTKFSPELSGTVSEDKIMNPMSKY